MLEATWMKANRAAVAGRENPKILPVQEGCRRCEGGSWAHLTSGAFPSPVSPSSPRAALAAGWP